MHVLHSKHGVYEELEAAHADATCGAVLVELHRTEVIAEEPAHVLEYTVCGSRKSTQERRLSIRLLFTSLAFWNMFSCECGWLIMEGQWFP